MKAPTLVLATVLAATSGRAVPARAPAGGGAPAGGSGNVSAARVEALVHDEANAARRRAGRAALGRRADLARVGRAHSRDMAARDYFSHTGRDGRSPQQRASAAGVNCRQRQPDGSVRIGVSENLFQTWVARRVEVIRDERGGRRVPHNRSEAQIAQEVVRGWLDSAGHRRTLLDSHARHHGIGVAVRRDGAVFVTEVVC